MTTVKHTPGPWFIKQEGSNQVFAKNNGSLSASFQVATANYTDSKSLPLVNGNLETAQANAKLIAAAPELLDVLILQEQYEGTGEFHHNGMFYKKGINRYSAEKLLDDLRAEAIKKATL